MNRVAKKGHVGRRLHASGWAIGRDRGGHIAQWRATARYPSEGSALSIQAGSARGLWTNLPPR